MSFTTVHVSGTFLRPDNVTPDKGEVLFRLRQPLYDPDTDTIIAPDYQLAVFDAAGHFEIDLVATDDPGIVPQGVTYEVTEHHSWGKTEGYYIELPYTDTDVDLADLVAVSGIDAPLGGSIVDQIASKVARAGDAMTGPLLLAADPTNVLGATTKQYVDAAIAATAAAAAAATAAVSTVANAAVQSNGSYAAPNTVVERTRVTADPFARFTIKADGTHQWADGATDPNTVDSNLYLSSGGLKSDGGLRVDALGVGAAVPASGTIAVTQVNAGQYSAARSGGAFGFPDLFDVNGVGLIVGTNVTGGSGAQLGFLADGSIAQHMKAGQTADAHQWNDSTGASKAIMSANGTLFLVTIGSGVQFGPVTSGDPARLFMNNSPVNTLDLQVAVGGMRFINNAFTASLGQFDNDGQWVFLASAATKIPVTVSGFASQSADLTEWTDSLGATLLAVTAAGIPQWVAAANQQTTVGAAGGASALPATPTKYLKVKDSAGTALVIPAYAAA